ncbi:MAG: hypothetical protein K8L97_18475 [Anaerolineae bacterium]|nr:hypothetical protein [Anaerolineae bacterium]
MSPIYWLALLGLLLAVTWLGGRKLNADGVWFDEWWSWYAAGTSDFGPPLSPAEIWNRVSEEDVRQGIGYPFMLAAWGNTVGWTEFATRALSLLAGVLTVAVVFRLGWAVGKHPLVGLGAAAALGTSVWFVYFLHEMRVYMFLVLGVAALLLVYQRVMDWKRPPGWADYTALALVTAGLLNAHYFAAVPIGLVGLWHLIRLVRERPNRRWGLALLALIVGGLLFVPWLANLIRGMEIAQAEFRVQPDASLLLKIAGDTFYTFSNTSAAVFAVLAFFSLLNRASWKIWLLLIVILAINLAAYYVFGLNELRYNMAVLPLLAVIAGFGIYELGKQRVPAALVIGIWAAGLIAVEGDFRVEGMIQRWPPQPTREMAQVLENRVEPDDVIINLLGNDNRPTLALHPLTHYMGDFGARLEVVENSTYPGTQIFAERVRQAAGDAQRLWLVYDPRWESNEWALTEYVLNEQNLYHCATLTDTDNMRIWGFGRLNMDAPARQFDGINVSLIGDVTVSADGIMRAWVGYAVADSVLNDTYSVALHVLDADGQLLAQADYSLPPPGNACRFSEIAGIPSGSYELHIAIYNWQTGERLPAAALDGTTSDYPMLSSEG